MLEQCSVKLFFAFENFDYSKGYRVIFLVVKNPFPKNKVNFLGEILFSPPQPLFWTESTALFLYDQQIDLETHGSWFIYRIYQDFEGCPAGPRD